MEGKDLEDMVPDRYDYISLVWRTHFALIPVIAHVSTLTLVIAMFQFTRAIYMENHVHSTQAKRQKEHT